MTHDAPQHKVEDAEAFVAKIKADAAAERERRQKLEAEHPPIELLRRLANPANPYPKKSPLVGKAIPVEADRLEAEAAYEELKKPKTKEEPKPKADGQRSKAQAKVLAQVEALNEKHFVVNNVGGKCLIGEFVPSSIDPKRTVLSWQSNPTDLVNDAKQKVPRLRDLSFNQLADFLKEWGCYKSGGTTRHWRFPPLTEMRNAWDQKYTPRKWQPINDWQDIIRNEELSHQEYSH